ncbi:hypothetical protein FQ775_11610 [Nitratireductor mangrovi]|uniref:Uncharacterized protein n=1 Tax=Nitratireductor mangrovi TaxID=2599600 RepID=A0A5B8KZG8_9HYPH|nr:hypothetical protein [Nitratireductor mangrovi]QDZ00976.1 hypothetical protein FQ775_11610 [Nitratireductor mangrovi]
MFESSVEFFAVALAFVASAIVALLRAVQRLPFVAALRGRTLILTLVFFLVSNTVVSVAADLEFHGVLMISFAIFAVACLALEVLQLTRTV